METQLFTALLRHYSTLYVSDVLHNVAQNPNQLNYIDC